MSGRGDVETVRLKANVEDQLNRLLTQLQDLEDMRNELDDEEYATSRQETLDQLREFELALDKMVAGNITLVDELGSVQLAIQAAIRSAFKSPEVIRMFAKKENGALRSKLGVLDSDLKLGRITQDAYNDLAIEILTALEKLGETLSPKETELLNLKSKNMSGHVAASSTIGAGVINAAVQDTRKGTGNK